MGLLGVNKVQWCYVMATAPLASCCTHKGMILFFNKFFFFLRVKGPEELFFLKKTCECRHWFAEQNLLVGVTLACAHSKVKRCLTLGSTVKTLNLESVYILCLLWLPGWNCGLSQRKKVSYDIRDFFFNSSNKRPQIAPMQAWSVGQMFPILSSTCFLVFIWTNDRPATKCQNRSHM